MMPTYEYKCKENGHRFSEVRAITDTERATKCPECTGDVIRVFSAPPVAFKGTGFGRPYA